MSALVDEVRTRPRSISPAVARAIRKSAGVTQSRLATELGVHAVTVARWEAGTRCPRGRLLKAYVDLLVELQRVTG